MEVLEIKSEFDSDMKRIDRMKTILGKLQSIDFFEGATVRDWGSSNQVYFKEDECDWLDEMWCEKINSLIDEIDAEEKAFIKKWSR
ncbi:hypothetical protein [Enterococcus sp. AZ103]|uniref:hypothetical protein n=1 Tax=Enterococcus sp. AZ103 TaxID=2774628 RepID=UPI003F272B6A